MKIKNIILLYATTFKRKIVQTSQLGGGGLCNINKVNVALIFFTKRNKEKDVSKSKKH